jgi:hypothetical protein
MNCQTAVGTKLFYPHGDMFRTGLCEILLHHEIFSLGVRGRLVGSDE